MSDGSTCVYSACVAACRACRANRDVRVARAARHADTARHDFFTCKNPWDRYSVVSCRDVSEPILPQRTVNSHQRILIDKT